MSNISDQDSYFQCNPEVVLREEDEDGALLFNPDTNQVKIINITGLFIWKQCDGSRNLSDICQSLEENFENFTPEQVTQDISDYIKEMISAGFIGTVVK